MKKALCKVSIIPLIICLIFSVYQSTAFAKSNDTSIKDVKISEMQEPSISITCKAENGDTQKYTFKIKRIDKTVSEIEEEIGKNGYAVYINKSKFYQQTDFLICLGTVLTGIIILTLLYLFFRKKLIKPYDESEEQFYLAD